jgi:uncharacterized protein with PQ loop repeat
MQISAVFEILGIMGSLIICASAIPHAVKTYRVKRSHDLSIVYLSNYFFRDTYEYFPLDGM